jgi:hypothetical protein
MCELLRRRGCGGAQMRGEGMDSPYHMSPIVARIPIGMKYTHRIMMSNPHSEPLVIQEVRRRRACSWRASCRSGV